MCIHVYAYIHCVCVCCVCGESGGVERVEGWREWRGGESGGAIDMHVLRVYVLCRFGVI